MLFNSFIFLCYVIKLKNILLIWYENIHGVYCIQEEISVRNIQEEKVLHIVRFIFGVLVAVVFLYFILGELLLPREHDLNDGKCELLDTEWYRILGDGTEIPIEVPSNCKAERGEPVVFVTRLPTDIVGKTWVCFRSSQQDMKIYVGSELKQSYSTKEVRLFGKNSISAYVFAELNTGDAGKILWITTVSDSNYSGVMNEVYIGDKSAIWQYFIKEHGPAAVVAIIVMILGIISIIISIVLRVFYHRTVMIEYLAWGIFLASVWLLSESRLRQLVLPNITVIASMAFLAIMLLPFPIALYVNNVQKGRYQKWYMAICGLATVDFVVCTMLQVMNICDFLDTMIFMVSVIVLLVIVTGISIVQDIKKGFIKEYTAVAVGLIGLMITAIGEIVGAYNLMVRIPGVVICGGLVFLLVMTAIKTGQDVMSIEREKQKAVFDKVSQTRFLAHMSHEIRTPLNVVIGMNTMILKESRENKIQEYAQKIDGASKMLLNLISDVLDFSKMEQGSMELEENSYYLASLINDEVLSLKAKAEEKGLEVRVQTDELLPTVLQGDVVRIKQIMTHMIKNAVNYTHEGGITLSVQGIWNDREEFQLVISVADTGEGIRKEDMDRLFNSFTKLQGNNSQFAAGNGLGLSITKTLVTKMGGTIRVNSVYGKGSMFTVKIPQKVVNKEPIGNMENAYEKSGDEILAGQKFLHAPKANILVVDDNDMNLTVIKELLKQSEICLDTVLSGKECLEISKKKKYDLIFMDHMMPKMDGVETLHMLKMEKDNPNADTAVIMLTANAITGMKEQYIEEGFKDYISKPVEIDKLEKILYEHLPEGMAVWKEATKQVQEEAVTVKEQESSQIDKSIGMNYCGGSEDMYREIAKAYHQQGMKYVAAIPQLCEKGEWKDYAVIAHAIKSTSLTIGATVLSEEAKVQELAAKEGKTDILETGWETFYQNYRQVLQEVEMLFGINDSKGKEEEQIQILSKEEYLEECRNLLQYIKDYEMGEAMEQIEKLLQLGVSQEEREQEIAYLEKIRAAVDEFEYDLAEELLTEWLKKQEAE